MPDRDSAGNSRKTLLMIAATASVVIVAAAGVYFWDTLVVGFLAVLLWAKKLASIKGLLFLLKKLPWLLVLGLKRLVIKITSHFLLYSAHLRFRKLRRLLRYLRARARVVKSRMKYHWSDLSGLEQVMAVVAALPLALILSVMMLVFVMPKVLLAYLGGRVKEHSSAAVLKQVAELGVKEKLNAAEAKIKQTLKRNIPSDANKPTRDDDAT